MAAEYNQLANKGLQGLLGSAMPPMQPGDFASPMTASREMTSDEELDVVVDNLRSSLNRLERVQKKRAHERSVDKDRLPIHAVCGAGLVERLRQMKSPQELEEILAEIKLRLVNAERADLNAIKERLGG